MSEQSTVAAPILPPVEYRDVLGWEGHYAVSNYGRVLSLPRVDRRGKACGGQLMKVVPFHKKYAGVILSRNGRIRREPIHRLVAIAHLSMPTAERPFINHKDGDKLNNYVGNLEWCSVAENNAHAWQTGLTRMTDERRAAIAVSASTAERLAAASALGRAKRKLSADVVREAKHLLASGASRKEVCRLLAMNKTTLGEIARGDTYKDIT